MYTSAFVCNALTPRISFPSLNPFPQTFTYLFIIMDYLRFPLAVKSICVEWGVARGHNWWLFYARGYKRGEGEVVGQRSSPRVQRSHVPTRVFRIAVADSSPVGAQRAVIRWPRRRYRRAIGLVNDDDVDKCQTIFLVLIFLSLFLALLFSIVCFKFWQISQLFVTHWAM